MDSLAKELQTLEKDNPSSCSNKTELYRSLKRELAELELLQAKRIFRARANWAQQGERPNSFFLNWEKRRSRANTLSLALNEDSDPVSDPKGIPELARSFYDKLIVGDATPLRPIDDMEWQSLDIPKISEEHHNRLEEAYSEKEFHQALLKLNKGKTPGSDGLTVDFYVCFWDQIKSPLMDSLYHGLLSGELSTEQKRGIITLIPKKGVDRRKVQNWRPISLLNKDNKILTKAMSLRLQPVLKEIIHADQTGILPGRYIGENLRTIQDVIDFTRASSQPALLLALDFRKAFDSVRWQFVLRALGSSASGKTSLIPSIQSSTISTLASLILDLHQNTSSLHVA